MPTILLIIHLNALLALTIYMLSRDNNNIINLIYQKQTKRMSVIKGTNPKIDLNSIISLLFSIHFVKFVQHLSSVREDMSVFRGGLQ